MSGPISAVPPLVGAPWEVRGLLDPAAAPLRALAYWSVDSPALRRARTRAFSPDNPHVVTVLRTLDNCGGRNPPGHLGLARGWHAVEDAVAASISGPALRPVDRALLLRAWRICAGPDVLTPAVDTELDQLRTLAGRCYDGDAARTWDDLNLSAMRCGAAYARVAERAKRLAALHSRGRAWVRVRDAAVAALIEHPRCGGRCGGRVRTFDLGTVAFLVDRMCALVVADLPGADLLPPDAPGALTAH